ncbi:MAG: recombinase family protein [Planctomycetota bacterium]
MNQQDTGSSHAAVAADVVAYGRFSSDHQRPSSIDDQAAEGRRFAEQRTLPVPGRIVKDEGVSVKDGMAPNFERLLDEVRAGSVKMIFVDELSRISRVAEDILRVQRLLRYHGVQLWAVHENIEITDDSADIHVLFASHKNQAATRDARHRVKRSMNGNMERGLSNGDLRLGYTSVALTDEEARELGLRPRGKDDRPYKRLAIQEDEAETVRLILWLYVVAKRTIRGIARYLNENNVPRGGKARKKRWLPIDVRKVLSNRRYLGYRWRNLTMIVTNPDTGGKTCRPQSKDELIETHDPSLAIIDQATFDAAQQRLAENKEVYGKRHGKNGKRSGALMSYAPRKLLSGTIICGECEAALVQKHAGKVAYYVCPNAQCGVCGNTVQTRRDLVHELVLEAIRDQAESMYLADRVHELLAPELETILKESSGETADLERNLDGVAKEIDNLTSALAQRPDSSALFDALDAREADRDRLNVQLREAKRRTARPSQPPTVEWVREHLASDLAGILAEDASRAAHLVRAITGPIRVFPKQLPWLTTRYPVVRFSLDFARMMTANAADRGQWPGETVEGGFGVAVEFEVRKVPLYEQYAAGVVRLRDEDGLGWTEISRRLSEEISPQIAKIAYRFGKTGDLYGHRKAREGSTERVA